MKPYALTLVMSSLIIFILRVFYPHSTINVAHNINLVSVSEISTEETKNLVFFYLMGTMLSNYIIFHQHLLFKLTYGLLIMINIILIVISLKQF